ncbi:helix-turn-helix domain-containing protein [Nocardiopsis composta]|uniref:HTH-type transcriptional regulator RipA n=1 Tax=Nocardiopsis composta TaxID=157465 RepID=A0A7W8QTA2_9ACTN|nr:helix-turn-helix domain-containing protein [Nocardiopsis composta]MBB5436129.1 AraC-like DNA-binding protein/quercetin dioxygenase-like cupin family protein [Nocardiopsis composta]
MGAAQTRADPGRANPGGADSRRLPRYAAGEIDVPFVIKGKAEDIPRDTYWEEHSHPTHELLWNERGASSATVGRRVWTITPTVGLWIPAGTPHSGWTPAGTRHRAAQFSVHAVPAVSDRTVAVQVTPLLGLLLDRLDEGGLAAGERSRTEAMVLDVLAPSQRELILQIPESPLLAPIVAAVRADPGDPTTLAAWAGRLGVSARTLTRAFRAETGLGFSRWVATARVQRAVEMLARGEEIEEVAACVGYHSASAFGVAFRRITGLSPGRFRAQ